MPIQLDTFFDKRVSVWCLHIRVVPPDVIPASVCMIEMVTSMEIEKSKVGKICFAFPLTTRLHCCVYCAYHLP